MVRHHSIGIHYKTVDILLPLNFLSQSQPPGVLETQRLAWPSIRAELTRWNLTGDVIAQLGELSEMAATFDVAVLQHVLCSVEDPHKLLLEARQLLKPGRTVEDGWKNQMEDGNREKGKVKSS